MTKGVKGATANAPEAGAEGEADAAATRSTETISTLEMETGAARWRAARTTLLTLWKERAMSEVVEEGATAEVLGADAPKRVLRMKDIVRGVVYERMGGRIVGEVSFERG